MNSRILGLALLLGASAAPALVSAAPAAFTYAGELHASNGLPYSGAVDVEVEIFASASSTTALWTAPAEEIFVQGGVLQVELESVALSSLFAAQDTLWLEFTIDGETLSPRQRVTSVPYAAAAGDANTLGGKLPSAFVAAGATIAPSTLPADGIGQISNGALDNTFQGVTWTWGGNSTPIGDAPAVGVSANVLTSETGNSYLTSLTITTQHTLTFPNVVRLRLFPPPSSGLNPIVLFNGTRAAGTYNDVWTPGNTPELAALLGEKVEGQWTFEITDIDDNAASGITVGALNGFNIAYDVVRSDHLVLDGRLDVGGPLFVQGKLSAAGTIEAQGPIIGRYIGYSGWCNSHGPKANEARYCLDNQRLNTAQEYFTVNTNGTITFLKAGVYKAELSTMVLVSGGWARLELRHNGTSIGRGYEDSQPGWGHVEASAIFTANVGDVLEGWGVNSNNASQNHTYHCCDYGGVKVQFLGN